MIIGIHYYPVPFVHRALVEKKREFSFSRQARLSLLAWKSVSNVELFTGVNNGFFTSGVS